MDIVSPRNESSEELIPVRAYETWQQGESDDSRPGSLRELCQPESDPFREGLR